MKSNKLWMLDAHCDSIYSREFYGDKLDLFREKINFSKEMIKLIAAEFKVEVKPEELPYHVTLPRLQQGNIGAVYLNVGDVDLLKSSVIIDEIYRIAAENSDQIAICYNSDNVYKTVEENKIAFILSIESQLMFSGQIDLLRNWHRLGIRMANLTHGEGTEGLTKFAGLALRGQVGQMQKHALQITPSTESLISATKRNKLYKKELGLTKFGKLALQEMGKLKIVCDLAHANDSTFWETLELTSGKVCVTHSNCAKLCGHSRNLTDSMMKALADHGGVMGLCFFGEYIDQDKPSLDRYVNHILHALTIMGPDHVGIGSDYDGVPPDAFMAIPSPDRMHVLWEALNKAGVDELTMRKIAHENFLNLLEPV